MGQQLAGESRPLNQRLWAALPIPIFTVAIAVLFTLDVRTVFEPPLLLPSLNTVFLAVIPFTVAYLSARSYLSSGSPSFLWLGCGMTAWGLGGLMSGWMLRTPGGSNAVITIYNTGVLSGSLFHTIGTVLATKNALLTGRVRQRRNFGLMLAYAGALLLMVTVVLAAWQGAIPPFFIQGVGPTLLNKAVLGGAITLFVLSALLCAQLYFRLKTEFLYWYFLALVLVALGLLAVLLQKAVGSPIGWVGRSAQYLGGLYFLISVVTVVRKVRVSKMPIERIIADFFREADTNYRTLIEMATDAIISCDDQGRVLSWNPAAERLFGYSRVEMVGSRFNDFIVLEEKDYYSLETKPPQTGTGPVNEQTITANARGKDGLVTPVEISSSTRQMAWGTVTICLVRNITERVRAEAAKRLHQEELTTYYEHLEELVTERTAELTQANRQLYNEVAERKQAEESLRQSEARFHSIFAKHAAIMLLVEPASGQIIEANLAAEEFYGYPVAQLCTMNIAELNMLTPEQLSQERQNALDEKRNYFIFPHRLANDEIRTVEVHSSPIVLDNQQILFSIIHDITERQLAEKALSESEERLELTLKGANLGAWDWHVPTGEVIFNERWAEMLGYSLAEIEPHVHSWEKLVHPDDLLTVMTALNAHLERYSPTYQVEHRLQTKSGEWKWVLTVGRVIERDERGYPLRAVGIHQDISEHKQAEIEREKLIGELQTALGQVKRLSGLIPICASCKKIRDDQGYWQQVEIYIRDHSEADFSHGICPDCMSKLYPKEQYPFLYQE